MCVCIVFTSMQSYYKVQDVQKETERNGTETQFRSETQRNLAKVLVGWHRAKMRIEKNEKYYEGPNSLEMKE